MGNDQAKPRSYRFDDDVIAAIEELPGKTANDKLRGALLERSDLAAETLDLVRGLPDLEDIKAVVEDALQAKIDERAAARTSAGPGFHPASAPGVQMGAHNLQPRRETGDERAARLRQDRENRAAALDPSGVDRDDIDRSDEFVSQA